MRVVVTGGTGYVGSRVASALDAQGASVLRFGHTDFSLTAGIEPARLEGVQGLVHAAWDFRARTAADIDRINVEGSMRLLNATVAAGVERVVFVSTLSAFPGCGSLYGRAKLAVEDHARMLGGVVVRPGLVWGEPGGSLYATLARLALRAPLLPVFTGERKQLHLSHEDDLARLVASVLVGTRSAGRTIAAAAAEPLSLADILRRIAASNGRPLRVVGIPWRAAWGALRALELMGLDPPFRSDSVVSLVGLSRDPFGPDGPPPGFRSFRP